MSDGLDTLLVLIDQERWREALPIAIDQWRATRLPELADLVDRLAELSGDRADPPDTGIAARDLDYREASMMRLAHWDDPRATRRLLDYCEQMPIHIPRSYGQAHDTPHYDRVFDEIAIAFAARPDARYRDRFLALRDRPTSRSHGGRRYQKQVGTAAMNSIDGHELARAAPNRAYLPDDLWLEVAANPDDDQPRRVLADSLLDRGDPRGMVFALQLSGGKPHKARSLVVTNWSAWMGDSLARLALRRFTTFERGMIDSLKIGPGSTPSWIFDDAIGHRELLCARTIRTNLVNPPDYARLVAQLPNIRTAEIDSLPIARALDEAGALERLERVELRLGRGYSLADFTALVELLALHPLREIWIHDSLARIDYLDILFAGGGTATIVLPSLDPLLQRYARTTVRFR